MTIDKNELPFAAESRDLPWSAAFSWLAAGWRDFRQVPRIALSYGLIIFLVSWGVSLFAWWLGKFALLASFLSGFIFIAPLLAIGLHSVSKDLDNGRKASFRRSFAHMLKDFGQIAVYALILMVILFIWSRSGMMLYAFFPVEEGNRQVLLEFLAVGSVIGTGFVALVFASAAFSLPMIIDKDCDMITALISSINAVLRNKPAMAVWSLSIVTLTAIGFATGYLGFIVIMPWLAFSTWHAYRQTIDAASWDDLSVSDD